MYSSYQCNEQLEDDLYRDDDSEGSEPDSELEFHLYSQLHYSSNPGEVSELEDKGKEVNESIQDDQDMSDTGVLGELSENRSRTHKTEIVQIEKREKRTKTAKKKKQPKCEKPVFEEVIVIDSSPDVITLSEENSSDEKEGVCALKGQRLLKTFTSTPAPEARKRTTNAADPVTVSSSDSDSESDSQYVSSSSDSEHLENWMILGRGHQDGDQSISLNLDGVAESHAEFDEHGGRWLISDKDRKAQIFNKDKSVRAVAPRVTSRYYTEKNVHCRNCNRTGHLSKNCPEPKKCPPCFLCATVGHIASECPFKHCNNCGLPGHLYSSCSERPFWYKQCHRCGMTGHFFDACPEIWRQYHLTVVIGPPIKPQGTDHGRTPPYCYNCSSKGHFGHQCSKPRMFKGSFPSTPFIKYYDTIEDIKFRQHKIKLKVQNLKSNGLIPPVPHVSQSPSTSGPPRKKQKTSHDKSNHRHTPRLSFKSDLPASKHVFFGDTLHPVSKTKKHNDLKVVSAEKPWKPKRPVPARSRDTPPNAVVVVDDEDDFPRGGGQGEEVQRKKKNKKMRKNGQSLCWNGAGKQGFFSDCSNDKKKRKKKRAKKNANKNVVDKTYPTDENLFIIKQRKHKKC